MKNYYTYIFIAFLVLFSACREEDKDPFGRITGNLGNGAGLRTITIFSPSVNISDLENSFFSVLVEEWDAEDGALLESVDIFAQFQDFTPGNGDSSAAEVQVGNVSASAFAIDGTSGLPRATITFPASDAISALGLDPATDLDGGDFLRFRLALNLTDGSVFSADNLEGNVTGAFFNASFSYPLLLICVPPTPVTGVWNIEMEDSFGDGWNNATIVVTIDGTPTIVELPSGSAGAQTVTVPADAETLTWEFTSGDFDSEITFRIFAPSGNLVADVTGPAVGEIALNLCNE